MDNETMINISPLGIPMLAMTMLLDQLELCRAALADGYETVPLADGKEHDAVTALRETASGLAKVAKEITTMVGS